MTGYDVDAAIPGAGTAGTAACREAVKQTDRVALIDGGTLGIACARVGCMPSRSLIAAADAAHGAPHTAQFGVHLGDVSIDGVTVPNRVGTERDRYVGLVKRADEGLEARHLTRQNATSLDDNTAAPDDGTRLTARNVIVATGSHPIIPSALETAGDRLIIKDDVFDWTDLPASAAVFGAGVVGLELGRALSRPDVAVHLFGLGNSVSPLSDPELTASARGTLAGEFSAPFDADRQITLDGNDVAVSRANRSDSADTGEERFDYLLAATGRGPNLNETGLENTPLIPGGRGTPEIDPMSLGAKPSKFGVSSVFVTGDAAADLPLLLETADEGRIAGEHAERDPEARPRARPTGLGVVFSDPRIAMIGQGHGASTEAGNETDHGEVFFEDQGRTDVIGEKVGLLRVHGERDSGLSLGAKIIGPAVEHLAHLLAWITESKLTVTEVLQRPCHHPVIEGGLRMALHNLAAALEFAPNPPLRCIACEAGGGGGV